MEGIMETEIKINKVIEEKLNDSPEYVKEWYLSLRASKKTPATCRDYIIKIRKFLGFINENISEVKLNDITFANVENYFVSIQQKEDRFGDMVYTSDSYQQTIWHALNNFLSFLQKKKYISENYMEYIDKPKNRDLDRINEHRIKLTKNDFKKIISAVQAGVGTDRAKAFQYKLKTRDMSIMYLFMCTGMRETALIQINLNDIDFENKKLYVIDKGRKRHTYCLSDEICHVLEVYKYDRSKIENSDRTDALFITLNGERLSQMAVYKLVKKYTELALGKGISPHKLRGGFCTILYKETKDIEFVRRAVGHSNVATTQRYISTGIEDKEKASKLMQGIFF